MGCMLAEMDGGANFEREPNRGLFIWHSGVNCTAGLRDNEEIGGSDGRTFVFVSVEKYGNLKVEHLPTPLVCL